VNWFFALVARYFRRTKLSLQSGTVATPTLHQLLKWIPEDWDREKFVITGSATLAFRGIRDVHDLDILIHPSLKQKVDEMPRVKDGEYEITFAQRLADHNVDIFTESPRLNLSFEEIKLAADRFEGFYVQSPRHTLAIKALVLPHRDKDRPDILELAKIIAAEPPSKRPGYAYRD